MVAMPSAIAACAALVMLRLAVAVKNRVNAEESGSLDIVEAVPIDLVRLCAAGADKVPRAGDGRQRGLGNSAIAHCAAACGEAALHLGVEAPNCDFCPRK